jgi:hypothetical protein
LMGRVRVESEGGMKAWSMDRGTGGWESRAARMGWDISCCYATQKGSWRHPEAGNAFLVRQTKVDRQDRRTRAIQGSMKPHWRQWLLETSE